VRPLGSADLQPAPDCATVIRQKEAKAKDPLGVQALTTTFHYSADGKHRLSTTRIWGNPDAPRPLWIGHNPSGATKVGDGKTRLRIIHFCRRWQEPGFDLGNLYPFEDPDPAVCRDLAACAEGTVFQENLDHLATMSVQASRIVACFGNARDQAWVNRVFAQIARVRPGMPVYCLGVTMKDAPKHPLARGRYRVPDDQQPVLWRTLAGG